MRHIYLPFIAGLFFLAANAQTIVQRGANIDGINYDLYDDFTCSVASGNYEGEMVIPEAIEYQQTTYTVTRIGSCQAGNLTSVSIPKTVTDISQFAFSLWFVGPEQTHCALENYYVAKDNLVYASVDGVIYNKAQDLLCRFPHGRKGEYRVLDGTIQICHDAFSGSVNLTTVYLPASFSSFIFSDTKEVDGFCGVVGREFAGCYQLTDIHLEPTGREWGYVEVDGVLYHCANTGYIWQTEELCDKVGSNIWYVWRLAQYPPGRMNLTYRLADAPECCNVIEIESLNETPHLQTIDNICLPFAVAQEACRGCISLSQLDFTDVLNIADDAFYQCTSLQSADLSLSLIRTLSHNVFSECYSLDELVLPPNLESIQYGALSGCPIRSFTVPATVTAIGLDVFSWCKQLETLAVEAGNPVYDSRNDCNAIIQTSTNTLVIGSPRTQIPETVTSIAESAFLYCNIGLLTIPASVERIGNYALRFIQPEYGQSHSIVCLRTIPPTIEPYTLLDPSEVVIHVLPGCKEAYQQAEVWCHYTIVDDADRMECIQTIQADDQQPAYNLFGSLCGTTPTGQSVIIRGGKKQILLP